MAKMERRILQATQMEIRKADEGPTTIEGYAAKFNVDSVPMWGFTERIAPGTFTRTLKENPDIKALWNHDSNCVIGSTKGGSLQLSEDDVGLKFSLDPGDTSWGKDALECIKRGDVSGVSFGFMTQKCEWDYTDPDNTIRTLTDVDLYEISPTPFPAYPDTEVQARSIKDEFEKFMQENPAPAVKIDPYLHELRKKLDS